MLKHSLKKGFVPFLLQPVLPYRYKRKLSLMLKEIKLNCQTTFNALRIFGMRITKSYCYWAVPINWSEQPHLSQPILGIAKYIQISKRTGINQWRNHSNGRIVGATNRMRYCSRKIHVN